MRYNDAGESNGCICRTYQTWLTMVYWKCLDSYMNYMLTTLAGFIVANSQTSQSHSLTCYANPAIV